MSATGRRWVTAAQVRDKVRRRWDDGTLLRAHARGELFTPLEIPLRAPGVSQIGERLGEVQDWIADLDAGSRDGARYTLRYKQVGGQRVGRNQIPTHAVLERYDQAWTLLGVRRDVAAFDEMVAAAPDARSRDWLLSAPMLALEYAHEWPRIVAAYRWLDGARGSGRYLRQIDAPGVDTKFVEGHRRILAGMLGVSRSAPVFLHDLGLGSTPEYVRFRLGGGVRPVPVGELSVRVDELAGLDLPVRTAVIVENEITYLTLPVPADGVVIWGRGFDVARLGRWAALGDADVHYWGDLDTHGFAILHRLRFHLPRVRSFLMDAETLRAHRERWGREATPASSTLSLLTPDEAAVYDDLVSDRFGEQLRLEQERIDWGWALDRLPYEPGEA